MQGNMLIIRPDADDAEMVTLCKAPSLDVLQDSVGGNIETVPYFDTIEIGGNQVPCVAFCNEEGKLNYLPVNTKANELWQKANSVAASHDILVGPVIVLTGDEEFMESI